MKRINRRKVRLGLFAKGWKDGKVVLHANMRIPRTFFRRIEASSAAKLKIRVVCGQAMTNKNRIEDIIEEVTGTKKECLNALKIWLSAGELDFTEKYWNFT